MNPATKKVEAKVSYMKPAGDGGGGFGAHK